MIRIILNTVLNIVIARKVLDKMTKTRLMFRSFKALVKELNWSLKKLIKNNVSLSHKIKMMRIMRNKILFSWKIRGRLIKWKRKKQKQRI